MSSQNLKTVTKNPADLLMSNKIELINERMSMKIKLVLMMLLCLLLVAFAEDKTVLKDDLASTESNISEQPTYPGYEKVDMTKVTPEGASGKADADGLYTPPNAENLPKWYVSICQCIDLLLPAQAMIMAKDYNDAYTGAYLLSLASSQLHSYVYNNMEGKSADIVWDAISTIDRMYADTNAASYSGKPLAKGAEYREKIIKIRNDFRNLINPSGKKVQKFALPDTNGQG
jgi:hypothetical protein